MENILIFGTGQIAELAKYYFDTDSDFNVVAFCVDSKFKESDSFCDLPVLDFEDIELHFPPSNYKMFIALSYSKMNSIRQKKYFESKLKGYELVSYISSNCNYLSQFLCGENCFILEDNTIQPFVKIGNNVTLWSGNHIGHHSVLKNHIFISSHVVVSGQCEINDNVFLGVNSTIGNRVKIAKATLVGSGVVLNKNTSENSVYVANKPIKLDRLSIDVL